MKKSERMWWIKLGVAIVAAVLCLVVQVYFNVAGSTTFFLGVFLYLAMSDLLARRNGMDQMRGLKIGMGVFLFTWVTVWAFLYTIFQTMS